MNKLILVVFVAILIIVGCKQDPLVVTAANITGHWQWTSTLLNVPLSPTNPSTPLNSLTQESLVFYDDYTWSEKVNSILVDTGSYSIGHGSYLSSSNILYAYDSVAYFHGTTLSPFNVDYYKIYNSDSLVFSTSFTGAVGGSITSFAK